MTMHSPAVRTCRVCGCTDGHACRAEDGQPCRWIMDDLCSVCAEQMDWAPYAVVGLEADTAPQWLAERLSNLASLGYRVVGVVAPQFIILEHVEHAAAQRIHETVRLAEVARGASDLVVPGR